jgi:LSD1 subclass zinc finger protein
MTSDSPKNLALSPCACGGHAPPREYSSGAHDVKCSACAAVTPMHEDQAEAIAAWNRMQGSDDERIEAERCSNGQS